MIKIRKATINDAETLFTFVSALDEQSDYLLYSQDERNNDVNKTKKYLQKIQSDDKFVVIIAQEAEGKIVGFVCGETSHIKRISHVMKINGGVLREYRQSYIATGLGNALADHIYQAGILRVEARVIKDNIPSLNICKKFGLEIEGISKCSVKIGDDLYDEYLLSRLLV
jgi:RimJ/RimL family protein N-acetyltransferase